MRKHLEKVRKGKITKNEIIADFIFFLIPATISFLAILIFDLHWNFYSWSTFFTLEKHVFQSYDPYIIGTLLGGTIGFFLIKLFLFAVHEEKIGE